MTDISIRKKYFDIMKTQTGVDKYLWWLCFNVV